MRPLRLKILLLAALLAGAGLGSGRLASRAWVSVTEYRSPYRFTTETPAGVERDWRLLLVVVDGLRLDASRRMPGLNRFRAIGADLVASASVPSYSRPARATLMTGAPPEIHGATTNRHRTPVTLDNLFRGLERTQGDVVVVGSELWRQLFGADLERARFRASPPEEGRGAFDHALAELAAFEWEGAGLLLEGRPRIGVLDLVGPDFAAHEHGAGSPQYARACALADRTIQRLFDAADLWRTLVVVTADHGHLDQGGHGGAEDEVLRVPLVLAGRGVRAPIRGAARQTDVAPTVAALLGLPIPAGSDGRVLEEVLDYEGDAEFEASVTQRAAAQRASFRRELAASLGVPEADPDDARAERQRRDQRVRLPIGLVAGLAAVAVVTLAFRGQAGAAVPAALGGALLYETAFRLLTQRGGLRLSLSGINHEQDVRPYFEHVLGLSAASALAVLCLVVFAASRRRRGAAEAALLGLAAACGTQLYLLLRVLVVYWAQGLSMTWTAGSMTRGFDAVLDLGRMQVLGLAALVVPPVAWFFARVAPRRLAAALFLLWAPLAAGGAVHGKLPDTPDPKARWIIYLHGRIVELEGRAASHPEFGRFAFDGIVEALAGRGFELVAALRPASTSFEYSARVAGQVRKLKAAGVPSARITVAGFSKGGALARRASAQIADPEVRFVILAACPRKPENLEPWVSKMTGRMLSLYDASDEMVGSCQPAFDKAPGVKGEELVLRVGQRHGTFFEPRPEWIDPLVAFATR